MHWRCPNRTCPIIPTKNRPCFPPGCPERINTLKAWRDKKAAELEIDPTLICNKSLLTTLAVNNPHDTGVLESIEELKTWQRETFGEDILVVLNMLRKPGRPSKARKRPRRKRRG